MGEEPLVCSGNASRTFAKARARTNGCRSGIFASAFSFACREPDINQEIYGVPQYVSALQPALLNESATLFRRKYYQSRRFHHVR